jgi:phosphoribosylaminoimidazole-succinocarboxamide synthase
MGLLPPTLDTTDFSWLGPRYEGKVRDCYTRGDLRVLITTDRLSAFDKILTTVPFKGQVLTQLAAFWFNQCGDIVEHHVVNVPDPNVMVVNNVEIIPIEVVVRGYLAGSAWRDYSAGRSVSGVELPHGMKEFDRLARPLITPSTKAEIGSHDTPISEEDIVRSGLVKAEIWSTVRAKALALFSFGSSEVEKRGLILADTKYEFGVREGRVVLADEIHTLDSSRFWMADTYHERVQRNEAPHMLDKEPVRRWLMDRGFSGEGVVPVISDKDRADWMNHYHNSFERITGHSFTPDQLDPQERIERNLRAYFAER